MSMFDSGPPQTQKSQLLPMLRALAEQKQAQERADKVRMSAMTMPQPRRMTLLEAGLGMVGNAVDPAHTAGTGFMGGVNQGIQQDYQNQMGQAQLGQQRGELEARGIERGGEYGMKAAELEYGAAQADQKSLLDLQQFEKEDATKRYGMDRTYERTTYGADRALEGRKLAEQGKKERFDIEIPSKLEYRGSQTRNNNASATYTEGPKTSQTNAQAALANEKATTEKATRDVKVKKVKAEVQKILSGSGLDDARKAKVLKEVAYYDAEFASKAAVRSAQIAKLNRGPEGKAVDPAKANNEKRKALKDIIGVQQAQRKAIERRNGNTAPADGSDDYKAYLEVGKALSVNEAELQRVASEAVKGTGLTGPIAPSYRISGGDFRKDAKKGHTIDLGGGITARKVK